MAILEELKPKHVAEDFYIGNTHVIISDDYCRPREEVDEILRRIARDAYRALAAQHAAEQRRKELENERTESEADIYGGSARNCFE